MAIQVKIRRQLTPGSATTQDYTDAGLTETVKAALLAVCNPDGDGASSTHWGIGVGMGAGTGIGDGSQFADSSHIRPLVGGRAVSCDESIIAFDSIQVTPGPRDNFASLSAFITNGFRLSYSISTGQMTAAGVGFAGSDLSVASGISPNSNVTEVVDTGLDNVDLVLVMGSASASSGLFDNACGSSTTSVVGFTFGAVAKTQDGSIQQASAHKGNGSSCRVTGSACYSVHNISSPGSPVRAAQVTDITGGRVTFATIGTTDYTIADFAWVAFDFGGQAQARVQTFTTDRSDSSIAVDLDMIPQWAAVIGTHVTALDTTDTTTDASPVSFGLIDTDEQNVSAVVSQDGTVPGTPYSYTDDAYVWATMAEGGASFLNRASGSFAGSNLNLSFTDHDTTADRLGIVVAIGTPGDIAVDEGVLVLDEVHAQITNLFAPPDTDAVLVLDDVQAVLSAAPLEPQRGTRPKTTARAGVEAADTARPGADQLGTASS